LVFYGFSLWGIVIVIITVIIEITIGIDAARKVPITFNCDLNESGNKRVSISSDFMISDEVYLMGF